MSPDRPPTAAVAIVAAIGTLLIVTVAATGTPLVVAALGTVLAAGGVAGGSRRLLGVGAIVLGGALLAAGIAGLEGPAAAIGALAVVVLWTVGEQAIAVTGQVGRAGRPTRAVVVHAASVTLAAGVVLVAVLGLSTATNGGLPITVLLCALLGGLLAVGSIRL